jgi:GxGYxYP putative glycoside hydrolase C-terminal domain/GxGYxYP_N second domain/GxGYxYP third domain/GxGYxYP_N 1st domain
MGSEVAMLDWSDGRIVPAFQASRHLDVYDIRTASRDVQLAATTMAGIVNRPTPRVYLITGEDEAFWLKELFHAVPQDTPPLTGDDALDALLIGYRDTLQGLIIYDPNLIDTVNVATILAGQRDAIVVAPAMVQDLQQAYNLPVLVDLRTYKWRSRTQAYTWALQNLRDATSDRQVAGLNPNNMTGLRSFLVATRCFVYWLDSRKFLPGVSSLSEGLPAERGLMQQILATYPPLTTHLGWFIDESSGVRLTSQAAIPVLATDHFTNLEVWSALQPQPYEPAIAVSRANIVSPAANKIYLSFTVSDGDNLQYSQHRMLRLWRDQARGSLPIGWTFSPVIMQAAPAMAHYYRSTATSNDELIAGPSGAGYMFPSHWPPDQLEAFLQNTGRLMREMGMTTLEILDTDPLQSSGLPVVAKISSTGMAFTDEIYQQRFAEGLAPFGLRGLVSGAGLRKVSWKKVAGVPLYQNLGLADSVGKALRLIRHAATTNTQRPLFLNVYLLAWNITPSNIRQIMQRLSGDFEVVLPGTLLATLAETLS